MAVAATAALVVVLATAGQSFTAYWTKPPNSANTPSHHPIRPYTHCFYGPYKPCLWPGQVAPEAKSLAPALLTRGISREVWKAAAQNY